MERKLLTQDEFDAHIKNKTLRLAFVGMSNAGKSYRSKILHSQVGFLWYQVDEKIQKDLQFETVEEISSWLGYPSQDEYETREQKYLALEDRFTSDAATIHTGENLVFDTTGSVAHLKEHTQNILRDNCIVVHLDVGEDSLTEMIENFFLKPKPVCWCGYFEPQTNESAEETIRRCYPKLLHDRLEKYRALAHINVPARDLFDKGAQETLAIIKSYL